MSNNMNYRDEIQYNVTSVLNALLRADGKATTRFLRSEQERLRGQRASVVLNVSIVSLDLPMVLPLSECFGLNEQELGWLVEEAKKKNEGLILEIKKLRQEREAKKQAQAQAQPEPKAERHAPFNSLESPAVTANWDGGKFYGKVLEGKKIRTSEGFPSMDEARAWCKEQSPQASFWSLDEVLSMHRARNRSDDEWNAVLWR